MADDSGQEWDDSEFTGRLDQLSSGLTSQAEEAFLEWAPVVLDYAKFNAPWTDRTGTARDGLEVEVYEEDGEIILDLFHTAEHGYWLELIQNGRFATIMPTLETFAGQIFDAAGGKITGGDGGDL